MKKPAPPAEPPAPQALPGFRDISMPEIIPTPAEKSNTALILLGIVVFVLAVGALAYYLFRFKPAAEVQQPQPAPSQATAPAATTPAVAQPPAATTPAPSQTPEEIAAAEKAKAELQKKIDEEQKKLEQMKAEEAKKAEEDRKKAELARLQEQQKVEAQKPPEAKPEPKAETPPQEEPKPVQVQPPPPVAQEEPKPEPAQPAPEPAPAVPEVREGDLVDMTPDVIKPTIVTRVEPVYPSIARSKKIEGTVILNVLVSESGGVADVRVLREAGGASGLTEAAVAAVKRWQFRPAVKAGKRVKVWVAYPIVFKVQ